MIYFPNSQDRDNQLVPTIHAWHLQTLICRQEVNDDQWLQTVVVLRACTAKSLESSESVPIISHTRHGTADHQLERKKDQTYRSRKKKFSRLFADRVNPFLTIVWET